MSRRAEELFAAVDEFNRIHIEWTRDEESPNPDTRYWNGLTKMMRVFLTGDIPEECRELAVKVGDLALELKIFDERPKAMHNPCPRDAFWDARLALQNYRLATMSYELPPLEPLALLDKQGVSHQQIALIYNLRMPNGELAPHLVRKELDLPGSVLGKDWVDHRIAELKQNRKLETDNIREALKKKVDKSKAAAAPCPETAYELWEQDVGLAQSAMMLQLPPATVQAMFNQFAKERQEAIERRKREEVLGGPLPDDVPSIPASDSADASADVPVEHDIDQEIIELHREGRSVQSIKDELQAAGHDIDGRKVAAVIRAYDGKQADSRVVAEEQEVEAATA